MSDRISSARAMSTDKYEEINDGRQRAEHEIRITLFGIMLISRLIEGPGRDKNSRAVFSERRPDRPVVKRRRDPTEAAEEKRFYDRYAYRGHRVTRSSIRSISPPRRKMRADKSAPCRSNRYRSGMAR